jgi:hypothetical protein
MEPALNVYGNPLEICCSTPPTGFYRDGYCQTGRQDFGTHTVCAQVTEEFLSFSLSRGNNLISPQPLYQFGGLQPGDFWCLCISRWLEAYEAGVAPKIKLSACHIKCLEYVSLEVLETYSL